MLVSYHNHTTWSDGGATLAEQIEAARAAGLDELGISDHYVLHPSGAVEWSMPLPFLTEYVGILNAARETAGLVLRTGVEADYFPETIGELPERLRVLAFDYVIGSVHYVDGFCVDTSAEAWEPLTEADRNDVWRGYWVRIRELAESRAFDFVGHLDLPKKFGHRPTLDLGAESDAALDAIAAAGMAIEINTAGWHVPAREAYPSLDLLRGARERGIPLVLSADAHFPAYLTRDFDRGRALAREAGYRSLSRYERRRRFDISL